MGFIILALMKKICCVFITFYSLTFHANAQTFDAALASKLQNKIDSISIANNLKGISASVFFPGMGTWKGVTGISHSGTPITCLLYTSPSPRDYAASRMPSSA